MFDCYLHENNIKQPLVVLSDCHYSRFDSDVLTFLRGKNRLFITPPDTTGFTQLLDHINQKLHSEYRSTKSELFTPFMAINRESFMKILAALGQSGHQKKQSKMQVKKLVSQVEDSVLSGCRETGSQELSCV